MPTTEQEIGRLRAEIQELVAKRRLLEDDTRNRAPTGGLYRFTPAARKKFDKIDREIAHLMGQIRALEGNPVPTAGYSGRQTNRR